MGCEYSTLFTMLINGFSTSLFNPSRGFKQGFPMSPYLFMLVEKGLTRLIKEAKRQRKILGIKVGRSISLTYLLYVDDVLHLCFGNDGEG